MSWAARSSRRYDERTSRPQVADPTIRSGIIRISIFLLGRRLWTVAALPSIIAAFLVGVTPGRATADPTLPPRFHEATVITGLNQPVAVRFADDGRVFVGEKGGRIKVYDGLDDPDGPVTFADLGPGVHDFWDRGLLGLALPPDFPATPYVYVLYVQDAPIGGSPPTWGDGCPSPPGATTDGCVVSGRLSRLRAQGNQMVGPEEVLVEDWCQQYPSHAVGSLAFGPDGALYASAGEGASFTRVDYGQDGEPLNPCGDPPAGAGGPQTPPSAEGGALRSQDLRTPGDPTTLDGAIIRIDPATGAAMPGNPGTGDGNAARIVAYGLRNPFRFTIRPGTDELWIGDPGWAGWEEIDRVPQPTTLPVENFGWPCYEGPGRQSGYDGADLSLCESLYQAGSGAVISPYLAYAHGAPLAPGDRCPTGTSSISGLAFYQGGAYPESFDGVLFFADYSRDCIWVMPRGPDGLPEPASVATFAADAANPVDVQIGPGGDLFYVDFDGGSIHRIRYYPGNQPPTAVATADRTSGPAPLTVGFDGTGSFDPDPGDAVAFAWDLDGDGEFDDASVAEPTWTYGPGTYSVRLRIVDPHGAADTSDPITISASNTAPTVTIDAPGPGTSWAVGDTIAFSGQAADPQEGTLPASALTWTLAIHHCPSACHQHPVESFPGVASGSLAAPDHDYPSHLELSMTATDSGGLSDTESVVLAPRTAELVFESSPIDVGLTVDGSTQSAPFTRTVIEGSRHSLSAPDAVAVPGSPWYWFSIWSDGGPRIHDVTAPPGGATWTATYAENRPPSARVVGSVVDGPAPLEVSLSATDSFDPDVGDSIASYAWDLDGDGEFDDASSAATSRTYPVGIHTVRLRVTDGPGAADTDELVVTARNTWPQVTIDAPQATTPWRVGGPMSLAGHAVDPQEGPLPGSVLVWTVQLCDPLSCRPLHSGTGSGGAFTPPDAPYPSWIEIRLAATDSEGLIGTSTVTIHPQTVELSLRSAPVPAVPLAIDGRWRRSRFSNLVVAGSRHTIRAPARVRRGDRRWLFAGWSDRGRRVHDLAPVEDATYVARYRRRE